jgi:transketolase
MSPAQAIPVLDELKIKQLCINTIGTLSGMKTFATSAPLKELETKFGFEPDRLVSTAKELLSRG